MAVCGISLAEIPQSKGEASKDAQSAAMRHIPQCEEERMSLDNGFKKACPSGNSLVDNFDLDNYQARKQAEREYQDLMEDLLED